MTTKNLPFPEEGPQDGDVFYHGELVCIYRGNSNTWECRRINPEGSDDT